MQNDSGTVSAVCLHFANRPRSIVRVSYDHLEAAKLFQVEQNGGATLETGSLFSTHGSCLLSGTGAGKICFVSQGSRHCEIHRRLPKAVQTILGHSVQRPSLEQKGSELRYLIRNERKLR